MDLKSRHFKSIDLKSKSKSKYPNATLFVYIYTFFKLSISIRSNGEKKNDKNEIKKVYIMGYIYIYTPQPKYFVSLMMNPK